MSGQCLVCDGLLSDTLLSLGKQTVTKNLIDNDHQQPYAANLDITICRDCATVQLLNPWPYQALVPWHDWMAFREPEGHLDDLVSRIIDEADLDSNASILGISSKDDTTLARFQRHGFGNTTRINPERDLGVKIANADIETVQHELTVEVAQCLVIAKGHADCIIVRHILEHAEKPIRFLEALHILLKPNGIIVFEVPDCKPALDAKDYALMWEEHNLYFTDETLSRCLAQNGFRQRWNSIYPYAFENSIVVIAQRDAEISEKTFSEALPLEFDRFSGYKRSFPETFARVNKALATLSNQGSSVVLFGAGHMGCSFVNYFELSKRISFAVDDAPEKLGLTLPGSGLEIRPSSDLTDMDKLVCLLSVTPDKENTIVERLQSQLRSDVVYASIVSASHRYIGRNV